MLALAQIRERRGATCAITHYRRSRVGALRRAQLLYPIS